MNRGRLKIGRKFSQNGVNFALLLTWNIGPIFTFMQNMNTSYNDHAELYTYFRKSVVHIF